MQQQQTKTLMLIILIGLGLIGGVFGGVSWLVGGGGGSSGSGLAPQPDDTEVTVSAANAAQNPVEAVQDGPVGLFNYGGSTTWVPLHEPINELLANALPDFQLRYTLPASEAPGSGTGIKLLLDGQLSFSESSRPVNDVEYQAAQQRGFSLEQVPVAIDGIALAVHPDLGIAGLTVDQIQAIYRGEVSNWLELGGPDLPITALSRPPDAAGTAQYFLDSIVDAEVYGENVVFVGDTTTGLRQVLGDRGGIYYASAPEIVNQCSTYAVPVAMQDQSDNFTPPFSAPWRTGQACVDNPNTVNQGGFRSGDYPLTRRLFVIIKADGSSDETAGRAYLDMLLSPEGQTLIEQAGFVSVR